MSKNSKNKVEKVEVLTRRNFIVRQSYIGKGYHIKFTNKKDETITYDHDKAYELMKDNLITKDCWSKYKYYTSSQNLPKVTRVPEVIIEKIINE